VPVKCSTAVMMEAKTQTQCIYKKNTIKQRKTCHENSELKQEHELENKTTGAWTWNDQYSTKTQGKQEGLNTHNTNDKTRDTCEPVIT